jgi:cytochrome c oxidase assembly protein subunit 15
MRAMPASIDRHREVLRRLALLCALLVLVVTSASALLRQAKAGLACDDRAACYAQDLRRLQQGLAPADEAQTTLAAVRLAHRVAASAVLLLGLTMLMIAVGARLRREIVLTLLLLALAAFLAVLGLRSSAARVPAVVLGNLLGGFVMLAVCVRLARRAAPGPRDALRAAARLAAALVVLQAALGALTSASYAGLSCTGWGGCDLAEVGRGADWRALNPWREPVLNETAPFNPGGALVHTLHRVAGVAVAGVLGAVGLLALRRGRRLAGGALLALVAAQLGVGLALAAFALPIGLAIAHNVLAALLLATLVAQA